VAPFLSPASGFDAQDRRFGALSGNLFGDDAVATGGGAICLGGFGDFDDYGGGNLDARACSDPGSVDVVASPRAAPSEAQADSAGAGQAAARATQASWPGAVSRARMAAVTSAR
jgi:hypothetical protein